MKKKNRDREGENDRKSEKKFREKKESDRYKEIKYLDKEKKIKRERGR